MNEAADGHCPVEVVHEARCGYPAHNDKCIDRVIPELHELF